MRILDIEIGKDHFTAKLTDGRRVDVPYQLYPRLSFAYPDELSHWRLIGEGEGIHWESLDEDISLSNILRKEKSQESNKSLRRWLASRNQLSVGM